MLLIFFSNFTKDNLSKSGLTVYRKSPPPPTKKKIPNNNSAQGHLRAMSVIQVVQHRSFLNDKKKNESADSLTCAMLQENTFIDYKI